jgi:F0F1-type ATP synthase membrane subunit b/b'
MNDTLKAFLFVIATSFIFLYLIMPVIYKVITTQLNKRLPVYVEARPRRKR